MQRPTLAFSQDASANKDVGPWSYNSHTDELRFVNDLIISGDLKYYVCGVLLRKPGASSHFDEIESILDSMFLSHIVEKAIDSLKNDLSLSKDCWSYQAESNTLTIERSVEITDPLKKEVLQILHKDPNARLSLASIEVSLEKICPPGLVEKAIDSLHEHLSFNWGDWSYNSKQKELIYDKTTQISAPLATTIASFIKGTNTSQERLVEIKKELNLVCPENIAEQAIQSLHTILKNRPEDSPSLQCVE